MEKKQSLSVITAVLLILIGCVISACYFKFIKYGKHSTKLQDGKEVVASIDGFSVTADDVYAELKGQYGVSVVINKIDDAIADQEIKDNKDAEEYANNQIKAIKAQYKQANLNFEEALAGSGYKDEETLKKAIISDYKKNIVLTNFIKDSLTDSEINKYYDENISGEMTVRHILVKPVVTDGMTEEEQKNAEEEAFQKASDLINQLNNGADFETLAKENSDDVGTASQGGLLANFTKTGVVSEFYNASKELNDGEYTKEPVKTTYGYHVILKVSENEKPKLDSVIDDIKEKLASTKLQENQSLSVTGWDDIRKKHNISFNDSAIQDAYNKVMNQYKN